MDGENEPGANQPSERTLHAFNTDRAPEKPLDLSTVERCGPSRKGREHGTIDSAEDAHQRHAEFHHKPPRIP
ncbi:hypothetical protein GCM10009749_13510 [Agromyces neolithicus]|uniref:Uncharacterized protein n=1 Tax=Agromyces neolithicus TaxID=269420 RepID=A0ABP4YBE1_9MICO